VSKGPTPLRAVRVDPELWDKAQAVAAKQGDNLSAIIRDALRTYIQESETK
jgi:predicted transcriptional regulator